MNFVALYNMNFIVLKLSDQNYRVTNHNLKVSIFRNAMKVFPMLKKMIVGFDYKRNTRVIKQKMSYKGSFISSFEKRN